MGHGSAYAGNYTQVNQYMGYIHDIAGKPPQSDKPAMTSKPSIDLEKLKADMAVEVNRGSARKFSLAITDGKNPDFYRNFLGGQDKRMTADIFVGIAHALGKNPLDYVKGATPELSWPNATVLTSTFAILLDSIGVDPYADERAQKLAAQFPYALRSIENLHAKTDVSSSLRAVDLHDGDEDQSSA